MDASKCFLGNTEKLKQYKAIYEKSVENNLSFWKAESKTIDWIQPFKTTFEGSFKEGRFRWFAGGMLNASFNCIDRHLAKKAFQNAIVWEGDDGQVREITFSELRDRVGRLANYLRKNGVRKGDVVCIYMPMIPEAAFAMLACARIGAVHNVVFAGFSPSALSERICNCHCKVVITTQMSKRGGKCIPLLRYTKEAVSLCENKIKKILVYQREGENSDSKGNSGENIVWLKEILKNESPECTPEEMDSEDPLFILYTSGSTGKPKGLLHTTGGYLVYAAWSHRIVFDVQEGDVFGCVADVGWITGHTYVVYGPLLNGITTFMFEGTPIYPAADRYWKMAATHKLTQLYTSPTAIRAIQKYGAELPERHDLSRLRVIGSVGEPINPSEWLWFFKAVGKKRLPVVDTYWQTETGGIIVSPLPGVTPLKPGAAALPLPTVCLAVIDPHTGKEVGRGQKGVLCIRNPLPGMARTIFGNHKAYFSTYLGKYEGYYYTGDGAYLDRDGYLYVTGRVDDVISISGHRIGTAEIETAIKRLPEIVDCAVVAVPDKIKGQGWLAFCVCRGESEVQRGEILLSVRKIVGPFAANGDVLEVPDLPKTRSGKVMRRMLRKVAAGQIDQLGDVSTLSNPAIISEIANLKKNKENRKRKLNET